MKKNYFNFGRSSQLVQCTIQVAFVVLVVRAAKLVADEPDPHAPDAAKWTSLIDGKTLAGWEAVKKDSFDMAGKVEAKDGAIVLESGMPATGVRWTGKFPKTDYEITLEARRVAGDDFFCGLTFPVGEQGLSLIMGGWSGQVVGLSCIDGFYAIDNDTTRGIEFEQGRWYRIRVRVTKPQIDVWVDDERIIELKTEGHQLTVSDEMQPCAPLGLATWRTTGAIRNIRYRLLNE